MDASNSPLHSKYIWELEQSIHPEERDLANTVYSTIDSLMTNLKHNLRHICASIWISNDQGFDRLPSDRNSQCDPHQLKGIVLGKVDTSDNKELSLLLIDTGEFSLVKTHEDASKKKNNLSWKHFHTINGKGLNSCKFGQIIPLLKSAYEDAERKRQAFLVGITKSKEMLTEIDTICKKS